MIVLTDTSGFVTSFALIGVLDGGIEVQDPTNLTHFTEHFSSYRISGNELSFDAAQDESVSTEAKKAEFRTLREKECFSVINRGELWYGTLSSEQTEELKTWYAAWLNVTQTLAVPERPAWLN